MGHRIIYTVAGYAKLVRRARRRVKQWVADAAEGASIPGGGVVVTDSTDKRWIELEPPSPGAGA